VEAGLAALAAEVLAAAGPEAAGNAAFSFQAAAMPSRSSEPGPRST